MTPCVTTLSISPFSNVRSVGPALYGALCIGRTSYDVNCTLFFTALVRPLSVPKFPRTRSIFQSFRHDMNYTYRVVPLPLTHSLLLSLRQLTPRSCGVPVACPDHLQVAVNEVASVGILRHCLSPLFLHSSSHDVEMSSSPAISTMHNECLLPTATNMGFGM